MSAAPNLPAGLTWPYKLTAGHSPDPAKGACAMDAVNWLVHGRHGDQPACACPIIAAFVIAGNDALPETPRQRLLGYLHRIAGSRSPAHEDARLTLMLRALVRVTLADLEAPFRQVAILPARERAKAALALPPEPTLAEIVALAPHLEFLVHYNLGVAVAFLERGDRWSAAQAAGADLDFADRSFDAFFTTLDAALNAGPQGEPWSATRIERGEALYAAAGGRGQRIAEGAR